MVNYPFSSIGIGEKRENGKNRTLSFYKFRKSFYIGTFKNMNIATFSRMSKKCSFWEDGQEAHQSYLI